MQIIKTPLSVIINCVKLWHSCSNALISLHLLSRKQKFHLICYHEFIDTSVSTIDFRCEIV